jgi:SAM-dependent MidA family methyltransferase
MSLSEIITEKIRREGAISFRDFMEISLYWPGSGYYSSPREKIGKSGDFYTSPYFSSLFGRLLARQLEEMWGLLDRQPFTIVEYGAGTGVLCRDILLSLRNNEALYSQLTYYIIERSPRMREKERAILRHVSVEPSIPQNISAEQPILRDDLAEQSAPGDDDLFQPASLLDKVRWVDSARDLPPVNGCFLSNELLDNFSVHRVFMQDELMEIFVDFNGEFSEVLRPASQELKNYLQALGVTLPEGYRTEINLQALEWIKEVSKALNKGFVLTIDYGFTNSDLYDLRRNEGTLACYHKHTVNDRPYIHIGEQDITAHVNFSALDHWGRLNGLQSGGFTNQAHFLRGLGITALLHNNGADDSSNLAGAFPGGLFDDPSSDIQRMSEREKVRLLQTFLLDMGQKFKVLLQHKGIPRPWLSGFYFTEPLA